MNDQAFKDDGGRKYQATNDEYSLPADGPELKRLDAQHRAFKAMQGDKNYLAPIDEASRPVQGLEKRLLDVGTGTGIWAIEMAKEFPHVQVMGIDLAPVQHQHAVPNNCSFKVGDAINGLPYPEGYFDVVHLRALTAGIRDWSALINEVVRITKPDGLVVFMDAFGPLKVAEGDREAQVNHAPGFTAWADCLDKALLARGMDVRSGQKTIPPLLTAHAQVKEVHIRPMDVPMVPWSDDPLWHRVGELMSPNSKSMAETGSMTEAEFDEIKAGYMKDLYENKVHGVLCMGHVWAWKV